MPARAHSALVPAFAGRGLDGRFAPRPARNPCEIRLSRTDPCREACRRRGRPFRDPVPFLRGDLGQRGHVSRLQFPRRNARREVAISALLGAERIRNVDARHLQRDFLPNCLPMRPESGRSALAGPFNAKVLWTTSQSSLKLSSGPNPDLAHRRIGADDEFAGRCLELDGQGPGIEVRFKIGVFRRG